MSKELGIYHPVGSSYILPPSQYSYFYPKDYDWVVYVAPNVQEEYNKWLLSEGFKPDGEGYEGVDSSKFTSWKKVEDGKIINFIVTTDTEFFEKFILAARVCKALGVLSKSHRILIHEAILKGTFKGLDPIDSSDDFGYNGVSKSEETHPPWTTAQYLLNKYIVPF